MNQFDSLVNAHFQAAYQRYPQLQIEARKGFWVVLGPLRFKATYNEITLEDEYQVEITIPVDFPKKVPRAKETGNRIPQSFHHYRNDILCLGTILEINRTFRQNPTLLAFIEDLLIPYLYGYSFKEQFNSMPFGEWSHGGKGILECYGAEFSTESLSATMGLLRILAENDYAGHRLCPCDSGNVLRNCHGPQIMNLKQLQSQADFYLEYLYCYDYFKTTRQPIPEKALFFDKRLRKKLDVQHKDLIQKR